MRYTNIALDPEGDAKLFQQMANPNLTTSQQARDALWERYSAAMFVYCKKRWSRSGAMSDDEIQELVAFTFERARVYAKSFDATRMLQATNPVGSVLAWLATVARSAGLALSDRSLPFAVCSDLDQRPAPTEADAEAESNQFLSRRVAQLARRLLGSRDYEILMRCMSHFSFSRLRFEIPAQVLVDICSEYSMSADAIKQARCRAVHRLRQSEAFRELLAQRRRVAARGVT